MIDINCKKIAVIQSKTGSEFESAVNDKLQELCKYKPEIEIEHNIPFVAYIHYHFTAQYPECLSEAFYLKGFRNTCQDCEHCERRLNSKGEYHKAVKRGYCPHLDREVMLTKDVCDKFYMDRINSGYATQPELSIAIDYLGALPDVSE